MMTPETATSCGCDTIRLLEPLQRVASEEEYVHDAAWLLCDILSVDGCDIMLESDTHHLVLRASTTAPDYVGRLRIGVDIGLTGLVFSTGERVIVRKDLHKHPRFLNYSGYDEQEFKSAVVQPVSIGSELLGVAYFRRRVEWKPTKRELDRIALAANGLAMALKTFRNAYQVGLQTDKLGKLSHVASILAGSPYLEEILQLLVNMTAQQFGYKVCTVRLLDERNNELVLRATQATVKAYQRKRAIKLGESIAGRAIVELRSIVVPDVQTEEEYIGHDLALEQGLRSMICVPLTIQDRAVGVLTCYTEDLHDFEDDEIQALETIAKQAAVSIEHAKLQVRHTLMQEMHHRVKNNLQQVASLLRLQLRHSHYRSLEEAINDSLSRILAIAAVHDLLSREDLDHVGVRSIAEGLVHHQQQSFMLPGKQIEFEVRGEDVRLNMTQATQIALVLNELISNAVEHGFMVADKGHVHINVETTEQEVFVWVSNDGDPLPDGFDHTVSSNLGLQIVANLCRGLGGTFTIVDKDGWAVSEVKFSRSTPE